MNESTHAGERRTKVYLKRKKKCGYPVFLSSRAGVFVARQPPSKEKNTFHARQAEYGFQNMVLVKSSNCHSNVVTIMQLRVK